MSDKKVIVTVGSDKGATASIEFSKTEDAEKYMKDTKLEVVSVKKR